MRNTVALVSARFAKPGQPFESVALPHTWNALDGQDGGMDYFRGACTYEIALPPPTEGKRQFIEFAAANHEAEVFLNGVRLGAHRGGFSTFRFELTAHMRHTDNVLTVKVDNDAPDTYPQNADFTFFGGLYRPVSFIEVAPAHFDLLKSGSAGVFVTPVVTGRTRVDAFPVDAAGCTVRVRLRDAAGNEVATAQAPAEPHTVLEMLVERPALWNGPGAARLYTASVSLEKDGVTLDCVEQRYGYRSFHVDPERGFFLNGVRHPLHGVCRHQDRQDMGWAIGEKEHREDMAWIRRMGANSIRLAHYQHSQVFYDLCDESGLVVWAEIPYISRHIPGEVARENTLSQMRELIAQNYHHPSICFWGIGNELTMGGESEELYQNLCALNALAKDLDPSRLTTIAHLSMVKPESPHSTITDVQAHNIYLGWYGGDIADNGPFLDHLHQRQPDRPIAVSEYGADALLSWHSAEPKNHDYTEEYQALYHEGMLKTFASRPWLWATYEWNMFDFAADARDEGGCRGRNNKGLVTYDRKTCKDAFFIYQAYWTQDPMVRLCGRRFAKRAPGQRDVKVYSNCASVALWLNGAPLATLQPVDHVCIFRNVPLQSGENQLIAIADGARDEMTLFGVNEPCAEYDLPADSIVAGNWFDEESGEPLVLHYPAGRFSIRDALGALMDTPGGEAMLEEIRALIAPPANAPKRPGFSEKDVWKMVRGMSILQVIRMTRAKITPAQLVALNQRLNALEKTAADAE